MLNLGVRGRLMELLEPALWIGIPIGSISRSTSVTVGAEIRVNYDIESIVVRGRGDDGSKVGR